MKKAYFKIAGVDERHDKVVVEGIWKDNQETRTFTFDDFEMDYTEIKVGQKVKLEKIKDSEFFII